MKLYAVATQNGFWKVETPRGREIASGFAPVPAEYAAAVAKSQALGRAVSFQQDAVMGIGQGR